TLLLRIFHLVLLDHPTLHLLTYCPLLFLLVQHSLLLAMLRIIVQYLTLRYYPRHSPLGMLQMRYYLIFFVAHLYLWCRLVHYLTFLLLFVLHFLMFGVKRLLLPFPLVLLNHLMLHLPLLYPLPFLLVPHSPLLALPLTIGLCLTRHCCLHHLLLVMLRVRCVLVLFVVRLCLLYHSLRYLASHSLLASHFLMFGLTHLLLPFHLVSLNYLYLFQLTSYPLLFLLARHFSLLQSLL